MPGHWPSFVRTSLWQTPQACTLMRTCPTPGWGISRSTISKSAPRLGICAAFIGAISILVVAMLSPVNSLLPGDLENDFQLDRGTERKACNAIHQATWVFVLSEDALQQLRSSVSHFRLIVNIPRGRHGYAEPDDSRHFVERSQMFPCDCQGVERRQVSRLAPRFHIELRAHSPGKFRGTALRGKHSAQKKQRARLYRFHIGTERLRGRRQVDAKVPQPLLGAGCPSVMACHRTLFQSCVHVCLLFPLCVILTTLYHLPLCIPASKWSTSPVTCRTSVR